ncbi:MAG: hypothetical protein ABSE51_19205 [Terracidiphilus sp.]
MKPACARFAEGEQRAPVSEINPMAVFADKFIAVNYPAEEEQCLY